MTSVDFHSRYKQTYNVKYLYGFSYFGFSYFLKTQPISTTGYEYETRLARVCQNDASFFSYMEIPLSCRPPHRKNDMNVPFFNLATSGYLSKISKSKLREFGIQDSAQDTLYVSFGASEMGKFNYIMGSAICADRKSVV